VGQLGHTSSTDILLLRMDDFALTDELYIKMNARGVQLTEFENFKAWLQGYTEDEIDAQVRKDFFSKLDRMD
jgi:hypothetical protein